MNSASSIVHNVEWIILGDVSNNRVVIFYATMPLVPKWILRRTESDGLFESGFGKSSVTLNLIKRFKVIVISIWKLTSS